MLYIEKNEYGVISLDNNYIYELVKDSYDPFSSFVKVFDCKDGRYNVSRLNSVSIDIASIKINQENDIFSLEVPIVVQYGQSLSTIANSMLNSISNSLIYELGIRVFSIKVIITAVYTNKAIAKRHIVFEKINEK